MMKGNKPLLSIGLTTFNRPEFLKEAVDSILKQSFKNFELLISNDYQGSIVSYKSLKILPDFRIKIINQKYNLGETNNLNYLLKIANGKWFVWLGDDDLFDPNFLSSAFAAIKSRKNTIGFFSNYIASSDPKGVFPNKNMSIEFGFYDKKYFLSKYTSRKISLIGVYGVINTSILKKIGGMKRLGNSFGPYSDTILPILLSKYGLISWSPQPLVFLRTHSAGMSVASIDFNAFTSAEEDFLKILMHYCSKEGLSSFTGEYISNMLYWFVDNEWAVLNRTPELNIYTICRIFVSHQVKVNFPRLMFKRRLIFSFFILLFLSKHLFRKMLKYFFNLYKSLFY